MEIKEVELDANRILEELKRLLSDGDEFSKITCNSLFVMLTHTIIRCNVHSMKNIKSERKIKKEVNRILKIIGLETLDGLIKFDGYLHLKTQEFVTTVFHGFVEEKFGPINFEKAMEEFKKMREEMSPESMPVVH